MMPKDGEKRKKNVMKKRCSNRTNQARVSNKQNQTMKRIKFYLSQDSGMKIEKNKLLNHSYFWKLMDKLKLNWIELSSNKKTVVLDYLKKKMTDKSTEMMNP
mmetsp:Transcript_7381/g.10887  ORF Transcript_7381/g.10887 Transcript_7381/m.10887 type:complete len:102 (-) Transcript_7381:37-342(-)